MIKDEFGQHYLNNIYRGKVAQRYGMETAIDKTPVKRPVFIV
jgi:hypothetical protein